MSDLPYPGYPPSYKSVHKIGGYNRECLVVEIRAEGELNNIFLSHLKEQIEFVLSKHLARINDFEVVLSERFDPQLREGLRLN